MFDSSTFLRKDRVGGILMFLLGSGAILKARTYDIGSLHRMGPGFFPAALGIVLALVGLLIALGAKAPQERTDGRPHRSEWRAWLLIVASLIVFILLGHYAGLLPASFAVAFIAALADRRNDLRSAFWLALAMAAISVVVFWWALRMQFPLLRWG